MAQLAETSLEDATAEYLRLDEFGRDIHQREWTAKYQYIDEKDDEGDVIPDGVFSESDVDEIASDREDSIADDYDSEIDDPSTFGEFESEVDETEDTEIQQMIEAGFEPCLRQRERSDNVDVDVQERSDNVPRVRFADDDGGSTDRQLPPYHSISLMSATKR